MAALSAQDILRIWEAGVAQSPVGRALAILAAASPGVPGEANAALPVGRRDARLLEIREETFGPTLDGVSPCPRCAERIEFTLEIADLHARVGPAAGPAEGEVRFEDWSLRYRLPTSGDLAAAAGWGDPGAARRVLAGRCILEARRGGAPVEAGDVPPEAISRMAVAMAEQDPSGEVLLDFICPACGHAGQTLFDIAGYLWEEIRAQAQRLLHEVHALARAYGWREADILALSAARRRAYLEMAT
jgi:hypothetical protein